MTTKLDRISNLPDEIIHHIFSSLPTQYMVQSSVLSKRWRNLWCFAPTLFFDRSQFLVSDDMHIDNLFYKFVDNVFYKFVDNVLLFHDGSNIQKFRIKWSTPSRIKWSSPFDNWYDFDNLLAFNDWFDLSRVYPWIFFAISHHIPILRLDLCLPKGGSLEFSKVTPSALFMSKSLEKLTLDLTGNYCGYLLLPDPLNLSGLKFLDLKCVTFGDKESVEAFFCSCANLESLICAIGNFTNIESINIYAHQLKYLCVSTALKGINQNIFAPRLKRFNFYVEDAYEKPVLDCPSLISAYFLVHIDKPELHPLVFSSKLRSVCNAQIIDLSGLEVLLEEMDLLHESSISFSKLKFMELSGTNDTIPLLANLLEFSPNIESLVLDLDEYEPSRKSVKKKALGSFSKLDHLKSIVIRGFNGNEDQQNILLILLEKAVVLEKLTFYSKACTTPSEQQRIRDLSEKLSKFPNVRIIVGN